MSNSVTLNTVSALNGATYQGFATVSEAGLCGMITLRGDLASTKMRAAVKSATGLAMPKQRAIVQDGDISVAWMSPDELLILLPYDGVTDALLSLDNTLKDNHYMAVEISDARAVFQVSGTGAREVIAKLAPVDMAGFALGDFRRTRVAQVAAAFWLVENDVENDSVRIICFRSVAQYVFDLLKTAAEPGSEVGYIT